MKRSFGQSLSFARGATISLEGVDHSPVPSLVLTYHSARLTIAPAIGGGVFIDAEARKLGIPSVEVILRRPKKKPQGLAAGSYYYQMVERLGHGVNPGPGAEFPG